MTSHILCAIIFIYSIHFRWIVVISPEILLDGDVDHRTKSSPAHPEDSQWGSGQNSVVVECCLMLPEAFKDVCVISRTGGLMEEPGGSVYFRSADLITLLNPDLTNCSAPSLEFHPVEDFILDKQCKNFYELGILWLILSWHGNVYRTA